MKIDKDDEKIILETAMFKRKRNSSLIEFSFQRIKFSKEAKVLIKTSSKW